MRVSEVSERQQRSIGKIAIFRKRTDCYDRGQFVIAGPPNGDQAKVLSPPVPMKRKGA
jgi:hypothetical protein